MHSAGKKSHRCNNCKGKREGKSIIVEGLDAIDGTPILDIKPIMKEFMPTEEIHQPKWATDIIRQYWKGME